MPDYVRDSEINHLMTIIPAFVSGRRCLTIELFTTSEPINQVNLAKIGSQVGSLTRLLGITRPPGALKRIEQEVDTQKMHVETLMRVKLTFLIIE